MQTPGDEPAMFEPLTPVSELECVSLFAPWLDGGDGFIALQAGNVTALGASNAMKFGPLHRRPARALSARRRGPPGPQPAPSSTTPVTASSTPAYCTTLSRSSRNATASSATIAG